MVIIDPHGIEKRYINWRLNIKEISGIDKKVSDVILNFLDDMQEGKNTAKGTKKGARSFSRLNGYKDKLTYMFKCLKTKGIHDMHISEKQITDFFRDMRNKKIGNIKKSSGDYAKTFSSFWHWWIRVNKKKNRNIPDITSDLDTSKDENEFVYFELEQCKKIMSEFPKDISLMLLFMFDSIIRSPKELMNVRRCDITEDKESLWLRVREESSKTYERRIKLMLCADELRKYLHENKFNDEDFIFKFSPPVLNHKLKNVAIKLYGEKVTLGGKKISDISLYDFRHSGACFWRKGAYNTKIDALMYRGGWNDLRILNYYTKKLGMKDTISEDDMLNIVDKTKMEKKMSIMEKAIKQMAKDFYGDSELTHEFVKTKYGIQSKEQMEKNIEGLD